MCAAMMRKVMEAVTCPTSSMMFQISRPVSRPLIVEMMSAPNAPTPPASVGVKKPP